MPHSALSAAVARAGSLAAPDATDGQLLTRFARSTDQHAFAELVRRLGPMVLGVCRRVAGDPHLADDAFQAAFVVLARRAADVCPAGAVRGWVYGVAVRVAREARAVSARRRARERPVASPPDHPAEVVEAADADALRALGEEVAALPDHLRAAVVLCELDGLSRRDAAARLGVAEGTLSSRLAKARRLLAGRLRRRGLAPPAAGLAVLAHAVVPPRLAAETSALASPGAAVPAAVAALTTGVFRTMFLRELTAPALAVLLAASVALGLATGSGPPRPAVAARPAPVPRDPAPRGPNKILVYRTGHLILIDPDGKNETKLTHRHPELHPLDAKLSPDGKRVAVLYFPAEGVARKGKLYVRGCDEKEPGTDLGVGCETFFWSADGTEIAYSDYEKVFPFEDTPAPTHGVVNVRTKEKTAVKLPSRHVITDWSRDGKHFLTTNVRGGDRGGTVTFRVGIHLMNRDGTEHKALTDGKPPPGVDGRLSPDGRRVLLMRGGGEGGAPAVTAQPITTLTVLDVATGKTDPVEGVPLGEIREYCWSPDGSRIAYVWREVHAGTGEDVKQKETKSLLVVCDPDGKNAKTIASEKGPGQFTVMIANPDWR